MAGLLAEVDRLVALSSHCSDQSDRLLQRIRDFSTWADTLRDSDDEDILLARLGEATPTASAGNLGRKGNWPDVDAIRARITGIGDLRRATCERIRESCLQRLAEEIADFTVSAAAERRSSGQLEFHDLLVLARSMLRDPDHGLSVRRRVASRYERLLLDEFQDTDPIQIELAVLIVSAEADAGHRRWEGRENPTGSVVHGGRPEAIDLPLPPRDIAMFLRTRRSLGFRCEQLTANFRTTEPILSWINHTFGRLDRAHDDSQPDYVALDAWRSEATVGPPVVMVGVEPTPRAGGPTTSREAEAADVASVAARAVAEQWTVYDETDGAWRPRRSGPI